MCHALLLVMGDGEGQCPGWREGEGDSARGEGGAVPGGGGGRGGVSPAHYCILRGLFLSRNYV